jgi:hypothetical protein
MPELDFNVIDWLTTADGASTENATLSTFRITAGPAGVPLTEVEDTIARTVRSHIIVPAYPVARWLLVNWWRLRWEVAPRLPGQEWLHAHSMASIGSDFAWPAVQFSSDGEFIQVRLHAESEADVSAIRYLRDVTVEVHATAFESAVEHFLDKVEARVTALLPAERELSEVRAELRDERTDPVQASSCRMQALAGIDPGTASQEWLTMVAALAARVGPGASEEILASVPALRGGLRAADQAVTAMHDSGTTVSLDWPALSRNLPGPGRELPWKRGARLAKEVRSRLGVPPGPVSRSTLEQLVDSKLPLPRSRWGGENGLRGGFRNGSTRGRTALLVTNQREATQRFFLARLIGAAIVSTPDQHVLPVSDVYTAFQKFERSFAQEFLCPWTDLDEYTDQHGLEDDAIADAAEHFQVDEQVVRSALVNKGKVPRFRLQA